MISNLIPNSRIQQIETKLKEKLPTFYLVESEIKNCMRYIGIWLLIGQASKAFDHEKEVFWGWLQQILLLRMVVIDSYKILQNTKGYLKSIFETILDRSELSFLFENSRIEDRLRDLRKIIDPLKDYRNKRYAHLEDWELQAVSLDLKSLMAVLVNLKNSLGFISHYILNPKYLVNRVTNIYSTIDKILATEQDLLKEIEDDFQFKACKTILME